MSVLQGVGIFTCSKENTNEKNNITVFVLQWNLSNPTHQGTREMCRVVQDVRTCLIRQTKGLGKCVELYRMSEPV